MTQVYLDGALVPLDRATVSVNDRAILFGDGAYETIRTYQGKPLRVERHLQRLAATLEGIQIDLPLDTESIRTGLMGLIQANGHPDARVRITVTGGTHTGVIRLTRNQKPHFIMISTPLVPLPTETYTRGVTLWISPYRVSHSSPLARLKTTSRLLNLVAKEEALLADAFEAVFLDEEDNVLEGTASNVFLVEKGSLVTPALSHALLPGVTRDLVLGVAGNLGVPVLAEPIPVDRLKNADEVFITNTTCELVPVTRIGTDSIDSGAPGPLWYRLAEGYRRVIELELDLTLPPIPGGFGGHVS